MAVLAAGIFVTALNMRTTIIAFPPMMEIIRDDTGLSSSVVGLVMTLPVICFALLSLAAPAVAARLGLDRALIVAMALVCIGILIRVLPTIPPLYIGTVVIGMAIAIGNVLVPSVIKRDFPNHPGMMTAIYGLGMSLGGTLAAAVMVPIYENTGLGWRGTLGVLAIPTAIAVLALLPRLWLVESSQLPGRQRPPTPRLWHDLMAWQIALVMGIQSFIFYGLGTYAPTILTDNGMSESTAGFMWSICNLGAIPASFVMPLLFARGLNQRLLMMGVATMFTISIVGMLVSPVTLTPVWMLAMGIAGAGSFAAVLLFIVERSPDAAHASALSGMSQAVGYAIAAVAPFLFGALHDLTGGWTPPILVVLAAMVPFVWAALGACRPVQVGQRVAVAVVGD
jgi:CP family cyanate transporter-like MFS transporter